MTHREWVDQYGTAAARWQAKDYRAALQVFDVLLRKTRLG